MKKNGKKLGLVGTLALILLYILLVKAEVLQPTEDGGGDAPHHDLLAENVQESIESKEIQNMPEKEIPESSSESAVAEHTQYEATESSVAQKPEGTTAQGAEQDPEETTVQSAEQDPEETTVQSAAQDPEEITVQSAAQDPEEITVQSAAQELEVELTDYWFRSKKLRDSHFEKHGIEMGFETPEEYIEAANRVICNPDALHKLEAEDNDHIYFIEETNEFVVLSQDGYLRTYYIADGGIDYFNRQ